MLYLTISHTSRSQLSMCNLIISVYRRLHALRLSDFPHRQNSSRQHGEGVITRGGARRFDDYWSIADDGRTAAAKYRTILRNWRTRLNMDHCWPQLPVAVAQRLLSRVVREKAHQHWMDTFLVTTSAKCEGRYEFVHFRIRLTYQKVMR